MPSPKFCAGGADDVIKLSRFGLRVVGGSTAFHVKVVRAAIEDQVPGGGNVSGGLVVGDLVGVDIEFAELNMDVATEIVDIANFFLGQGADGDFFSLRR